MSLAVAFTTTCGSITAAQSVTFRLQQRQHQINAKKNKEVKKIKPKNPTTYNNISRVGFGGERKEPSWGCVKGCGACCKLDKGPSFATPEEIFQNPSDIQVTVGAALGGLYKSMIGPDGWCIHYEQTTRTCSIYSDRPYFCRVEPGVFKELYGIEEKRFNKEACSCCRDTIKAIYGASSQELDNFNRCVRNSNCKS